jgi:hypothetical protein
MTSYSKAVGDWRGEIDLMIFFVEGGNSSTLSYGDIYEGFYDALNSMYRRAMKKVLNLPEEQRQGFRDRLEEIMTSASGRSWWYIYLDHSSTNSMGFFRD